MIEMKMGVDHERYVCRRKSSLRQAILQHRRAVRPFVLEAVDVLELRVFLVPRPGIDEYCTGRMLDEQTAHAERDPVPLIRRDALFPKRFRHHAEHRAAIQFLATRVDRMDSQRPNFPGLNQWCWSGHAVVSFVTECGSAGARRFLRFPEDLPSN